MDGLCLQAKISCVIVLVVSSAASSVYAQQAPMVQAPVPPPQRPILPGPKLEDAPKSAEADRKLTADARFADLFGEVSQLDKLPESRKTIASTPAADAVFSAEAVGRKTKDIGDLLKQSKAAHGISVQNRTPIVTDTRVRGQRVGQVIASGSYWAPARMDLDTMMNKLDSRLIDDVILVKGPYAARYGPGFRFVDMEFVHSPRVAGGGSFGSSGVTYSTNGEQWAGRQSLWGGNEDFGYYFSYGHQTGNDYETGEPGFFLPTSYKSRDVFGAIGFDLNEYETIEVNILRLDQTDVEFPGLVYDINFLVTDGYELTYINDAPSMADQFIAEVWYNRTRFEGDTLRPGKNRQIPTLELLLDSPSGFDGYAITDGDALSGGYRFENRYLTDNGFFSLGTDLIILNQELNDIEPLAPPGDNNFPIPRSESIDVGVYAEDIEHITGNLSMTAGARLDGVFTDAVEIVDGVPFSTSLLKDSELDQQFFLGAAYLTAEYLLQPGWTIDAGLGTAQRQPTLTELYSDNTFIGSLQQGLTFLEGDPQLDPERIYQIDAGSNFRQRDVTLGLHGHYSWIRDYITYDLFDPAGTIDGFQTGAAFVNTKLATLAGFEAYGQYTLTNGVVMFGSMNYVEGQDRTRQRPARLSFFPDRSDEPDVPSEPLPGIAPLETRLGLLLQDPTPAKRWGIEYMARIVNRQDRVAATLGEIETPGFTVSDLRGYWRAKSMLLTAGVENIGDKFYREHIDYRSGLGVFRPGRNFYFGTEINY